MRTLLLAAILMPSTAFASSVVAAPEPDLLATADAVVVGSVFQVEPYLAGDNGKDGVRTRALLQVHEGVRGAQEGDVLTVDIPGGNLGGYSSNVSGTPALVEGQLMLVFLQRYGQVYRPLGLSYGVYNVALSGARWRAVRNLTGLSLLNRRGQLVGTETVRNGEDLNAMLLRLHQQVKALGGLK